MIWVVGLTGGIGSGKSAVATRLATLGATIIDTDAIAHELTVAGGAAIEPIRRVFGDDILTAEGALDRTAMRQRIFADAQARSRLEGILHPLIYAECIGRLSRPASADFSCPYAVLVVPLLIETGNYRDRADRICVVDCPEELQIARTMARSGLSREEVLAIMTAQASRAARQAAADDVIDNSSGLNQLFAQTDLLHGCYCEMASRARIG